MNKTAQALAQIINGKLIGDEKLPITGITNAENPIEGHISFASDPKTFKKLNTSTIACIITNSQITESQKTLIQVDNPKLAWAKLLGLFFPAPQYSGKISEKAQIDPSAKIEDNVTIEAFAVIGADTLIGAGSVIRSHAFIDQNVTLGSNVLIHPHVMIYDKTVIGNHVIIHSGSVIGCDGFGYVATDKGLAKVPQVGNVIISDYVEIGANVTIDRATVGSTAIGMGTKIDNLVQIAHNVTIGAFTAISSQSGISGSSKIGSCVTMGGKAGIGDHVEIADKVMVGAGSGLPSGKKIPEGQIIFGEPARPYHIARKQIAAQLRSAEMYDQLKKLTAQVKILQGKIEKDAESNTY